MYLTLWEMSEPITNVIKLFSCNCGHYLCSSKGKLSFQGYLWFSKTFIALRIN